MTVAVVGAGITGLATAWALARRGRRVAVYDRGPIPNPQAASVDEHRLIRFFYPDEPGYCLMVAQAYEAWEELWADLDFDGHVPCGSLALSRASGDWADRARATLDELGFGYDRLPVPVLAENYPFLNLDGVRYGLFKRHGGVLLAGAILEALVDRLRAAGVKLHAHTEVTGIEPSSGRLTLADGRSRAASRVVLAAGAWIDRLRPDMLGRLDPQRALTVYVAPPEPTAAAWADAPGLIDYGLPENQWSVPPVAGTRLKLAAAGLTRPGDPDRNGPLSEAEQAALLGAYETALVDIARYRVLDSHACCYTRAPDDRFVIERQDRVWLVSACSGHGFKFGALIGREVAAAVAGNGDAEALSRWAAGLEV
ncbi:MAG: FAD-dependent oxidoreductase [Azospirillaceae bacterium]